MRATRCAHPLAFAAATILASIAAAEPAATGFGGAPPGGIWKVATPLKPMKGAFDNLDPIGLAAGVRIPADCSINWIDPDNRRRFCFSSGTSLEIFLERPQYNIERARAGFRKLSRHGG